MARSSLLSLPIAFAIGSLLATIAAALESLASAAPMPLEGFAGYGLVGGALAVAARWVIGYRLRSGGALAGALAVIAPFASFHLLYFVNVRILPGEPYFSLKSLAFDALVVVLTSLPLIWVARSSWARLARERWEIESAGLGLALLLANLWVVSSHWPAASAEPRRRGEGPNLILIVLDSARRDHLGLYGYRLPTSPSTDAWADAARVYETAYAASSWTVPSVDEILRLRFEGSGGERHSVQERLAARGYLAACFTDNPHMGRNAELVKGFDRVERSVGLWRGIFRGTMLGAAIERLDPGDDRRLVDKALAWAQRRHGPFFLYVHLMDSHTPYRYAPIDGKRRRGRRIEFPFTGMEVTPEEAEDIVARYDGGIRQADKQVGRVLAAARHWGRPYVAIVTSDHGESLGETGRWFHGGTLAPELLAVPLVVIGEGVSPGRVRTPVGHSSIMPTLLAAAGIPGEDHLRHDLRTFEGDGLVEGGLPPGLAYRIAAGFKVVVDRRDGRHLLFNLRKDPQELRDLARETPDIARAMGYGLDAGRSAAQPPEEVRERLRSLGYVEPAQ